MTIAAVDSRTRLPRREILRSRARHGWLLRVRSDVGAAVAATAVGLHSVVPETIRSPHAAAMGIALAALGLWVCVRIGIDRLARSRLPGMPAGLPRGPAVALSRAAFRGGALALVAAASYGALALGLLTAPEALIWGGFALVASSLTRSTAVLVAIMRTPSIS